MTVVAERHTRLVAPFVQVIDGDRRSDDSFGALAANSSQPSADSSL